MSVPRATLRLQFHRGFSFADATEIVPYMEALGISHLYASPILKARSGSLHGYDVIDPAEINPELGGEEAFRRLVAALRARSLGLILDIVPNHMAIGRDNAWWNDVLRNGRTSSYARFFDIDWEAPGLNGKILAPFLGGPYAVALEKGDLRLVWETADERYEIEYFTHRFPVRAQDHAEIERHGLSAFDPTKAEGRGRLHKLLERQNYRLAWWRIANDTLNWRRFFDINELAALRCEDTHVFEAIHRKIFQLYAEGLIDGVRIDHIDGLSDPKTYLRTLQAQFTALAPQRPSNCSTRPYIVVEKILGANERLPRDWACDGTTGYDFMDEVGRVLHDARGADRLSVFWHTVSGRSADFMEEERAARCEILARSFAAQRESAVRTLNALAQSDLASRDLAMPAIRRVLTEILAHMQVYRTYARVGAATDADKSYLAAAAAGARKSCLPADRDVLEAVAAWLGGTEVAPGDEDLRDRAIRKFQQLTAPLAAKAVEDTAFYRHGALLSRLDVGFDAARLGGDIRAFHHAMEERRANFPHGLSATATHDHKRGEDVRARLAVLSEIPDLWAQKLRAWLDAAAPFFSIVDGKEAPSRGDAAILLQMMVGAWPPDLAWSDMPGCAAFRERLMAWQQKALREAKLETDWMVPNIAYEKAAADFLEKLMEPEWRQRIAAFVDRIAAAGAVNGLAQIVLKLMSPGVPDIYQGTEFWDFSLVDPDNRRPVDFAARARALNEDSSTPVLAKNWRDGRLKQALITSAIAMRRQQPELFAQGMYVPVQVEGPCAYSVLAFVRQYKDEAVLVVTARCVASLLEGDELVIPVLRWGQTRLHLPQDFPAKPLRNVFTGEVLSVEERVLHVATALRHLPVALLLAESDIV